VARAPATVTVALASATVTVALASATLTVALVPVTATVTLAPATVTLVPATGTPPAVGVVTLTLDALTLASGDALVPGTAGMPVVAVPRSAVSRPGPRLSCRREPDVLRGG
jgi:hypothetical protein